MVDVNVDRKTALQLRRLGIDTYDEPVIYMRADCPVCRSEGFSSHSRVTVALNGKRIAQYRHIGTPAPR
jgi:thymidine phosphorylase